MDIYEVDGNIWEVEGDVWLGGVFFRLLEWFQWWIV